MRILIRRRCSFLPLRGDEREGFSLLSVYAARRRSILFRVRRKLTVAAGKFDQAKDSRRKNACNGNVSPVNVTSEARACILEKLENALC